MKQRRKWWQWLADKAGVQSRVDYEVKKSWYRMGIAKASGQPAHGLTRWDYPPDEATVQFFAPPPQVGAYEQSERQTGPQIFPPDSLKRMIGTGRLPAVPRPGATFERWLAEQRKKQQAGQ